MIKKRKFLRLGKKACGPVNYTVRDFGRLDVCANITQGPFLYVTFDAYDKIVTGHFNGRQKKLYLFCNLMVARRGARRFSKA